MIVAPVLLSALLAVFPPGDPSSSAPEDPPAVTLRLSDGTVLIGRIVAEAEGKLRVRTELLGEVELETASVVERTNASSAHDTPPAQQVAPPTALPAAPSAAGGAISWTRSVAFGGSFASAPYEQGELDEDLPAYTGKALGLPGDQVHAQLTLSLLRSGALDRWSLNTSMTFVDAEPAGRLTEALEIDSTYSRLFRGRDFFFTNTAFRRDAVRNIDNSIVQSFGVGRRIIETPTRTLDFMPGVMVQREEKGTIYDQDILFGYGFLQTYSVTTARGVGFDQRLMIRTLLEDASLFTIDSYLGVRAPLTKRLMLQVGLQFDHDEMLALQQTEIPGTELSFFANKTSSLQLTTGLQMSF